MKTVQWNWLWYWIEMIGEKASLEENLNVVIRHHDKRLGSHILTVIPYFFNTFSVWKKASWKEEFLIGFQHRPLYISNYMDFAFGIPILCRLSRTKWVRKRKVRPQIKLFKAVRIWKSLQWNWLWFWIEMIGEKASLKPKLYVGIRSDDKGWIIIFLVLKITSLLDSLFSQKKTKKFLFINSWL